MGGTTNLQVSPREHGKGNLHTILSALFDKVSNLAKIRGNARPAPENPGRQVKLKGGSGLRVKVTESMGYYFLCTGFRRLGGRSLKNAGNSFFEKRPDYHGIVVLNVMRTVEQGDVLLSCHIQEGAPGFAIGLQLSIVTPTKLLPFGRVMPEPASQCITGGYIFQPSIHLEVFFLHTARPEAIHKEAGPVVRLKRIIYTFDSYHGICLDSL